MISVIPFEMEHLDDFKIKEEFPDLRENMEINYNNPSRDLLSLVRDGEVVCLAGLNHHHPGVGELWLIPGYLVDHYKAEFFKTIHRLIYRFVFPELKMHRLEIAIAEGWEKGQKWAEKLGFKKEGLMEAYYNDYSNHYLYARVM